jgi:hypothetical protein
MYGGSRELDTAGHGYLDLLFSYLLIFFYFSAFEWYWCSNQNLPHGVAVPSTEYAEPVGGMDTTVQSLFTVVFLSLNWP